MYAWMVVNVNISTDEIKNVEHIQYIETKPINFGDDTHNRSLFCQQCSLFLALTTFNLIPTVLSQAMN